jgi:uncharacterized repeat protein (TIGR02543 family)
MSQTRSLKIAVSIFILVMTAFCYTACEQPSDGAAGASYKITFIADNGIPEPQVQTVVKGGKVTEPPLMTRSGYQFDGWYANSNCIPPAWDFNAGIVDADITLYARWITFYAVTDITGAPTAAVQGTGCRLTGAVSPSNATNKTIEWKVKSGSAIINNKNQLTATAAGTITVTAAITNGSTPGTDYAKDFTINVWASDDPRVGFLGHWFGGRGESGNPGYFDTDITITADKFSHLDGWGYYLDIMDLNWEQIVNTDSATQIQYPDGYTLTGTITKINNDVFNGVSSVTMYISADKQSLLIPSWTDINTASNYIKQ